MRINEITGPAETFYYFSYGMNTSPKVMSVHDHCEPVGTATLQGYHLSFAAFANISRGGTVQGMLWEVDAETLKSMDIQEGYPHFYDKKMLPVVCDGKTYNAIIYIMTAESARSYKYHSPSKKYIRQIVDGYQSAGIPIEQIKKALRDSKVTVEGIEL